MIASRHVGKSQRGVKYGGRGITSSCSLLDKSALCCGPAKKWSLDLPFGNAGGGGVEITLNAFNNKVWLRSRVLSAQLSALWSLRKNGMVHQVISSQVFTKEKRNAKVDLYQRLWTGRVILYQDKKKQKNPTVIILKPSSSQTAWPLTARSHSPYSTDHGHNACSLRRLVEVPGTTNRVD